MQKQIFLEFIIKDFENFYEPLLRNVKKTLKNYLELLLISSKYLI